MDFMIGAFQSLRNLRGLTVHIPTELERTGAICGGVIAIERLEIWQNVWQNSKYYQ